VELFDEFFGGERIERATFGVAKISQGIRGAVMFVINQRQSPSAAT